MQFPITIGLHRSRFLGYALLGASGLATGLILCLPRSTGILAVFLALCWGCSALAWRRLAPAVQALRFEQDGAMQILAAGVADYAPAMMQAGATVHPWLTVFRVVSEDGRRHTVLIAPDSASAEDFRRLRVFLRWRADFSGQVDAGG